MTVTSRGSFSKDELLINSLRRSEGERIVQLPPRSFNGCDSAPAAVALCLGHSQSSYKSMSIELYTGRRRKALFAERSHKVETPENEGLHLYFSVIASPTFE